MSPISHMKVMPWQPTLNFVLPVLSIKLSQLFDDSFSMKPQISTSVDCLWIKRNQANWAVVKHIKKSHLFSTTDIYVKKLPKGHFWFALPTDQLFNCLHHKQSAYREICGWNRQYKCLVITSICCLFWPANGCFNRRLLIKIIFF